jgi:methylthioribulose-1-phosphate dehydratase
MLAFPLFEEIQRAVYDLGRIKERLGKQNLFPGTSGNLSIKLMEEPLLFLVTASGKDKTETTPEDFLIVDGEGKPAFPTRLRPSAETLIHAGLYQKFGGDCGAVFHVHTLANNLISYMNLQEGYVTIQGQELIKALNIWEEDAAIQIPVIYNYAHIPTLAEESVRAAKADVPAVLIANHGVTVWGKTAKDALRHLEALEFLFEFEWQKSLLVKQPSTSFAYQKVI